MSVCVYCILVRSHIGAQLSHSANPSGGSAAADEPVPIIHVKYAELVRRVEADRLCRRRFVGGVMPDIVVRHWKQLGYSVRSGAQVCVVAMSSHRSLLMLTNRPSRAAVHLVLMAS